MPDPAASCPSRAPATTATTTTAACAPLPVVLDSNVWIDILVFDDPHTRPILAALERGDVVALIDARCLAELTYVLDYPQFVHRAVDKPGALAKVARLSRLVDAPQHGAASAASAPTGSGAGTAAADDRPLPKCKDRDDQKFLELAHTSGAAWLVSKDRAVLKLAKRIARDFGFQIAQPAPFVEQTGLTQLLASDREPAAGPTSGTASAETERTIT